MTTTASQLRYARSWIGSEETDAVFNERYDRLLPNLQDSDEALDGAIEESLREQLANLTVGQPSSMSLPGGLSASFGQNMQELHAMLKKFETAKGSSKVNVTRLVRDVHR